jgi:hypothetical protein
MTTADQDGWGGALEGAREPVEDPFASPDPSRANRVRALICTEPLHDLQTNRGRRGPLFASLDCYDIALAVIDFVVDHMGFDSGAEPGAVLEFIATEISIQAPDFDADAVGEAAVVINETLIRPQRGSYQDAGDPTRRPFDFQLLREEPSPEGVRVAATNEAINVLVGALDTDVASAHSAADAKVASLVNRKRFNEAELAAREARIRSIQYTAEVRRIIADTKLDVRRAGWGDHIPDRLNEILEVLTERTHAESKMLEAMRGTRDNAEIESHSQVAARLVAVVEDCFDRHRDLHNRVMEATETFFSEQERQGFRSELALRAVDPFTELLSPICAGTIGETASVIERFATMSWGVRPFKVASMEQLLERLLAEVREFTPLAGELPDEEFDNVFDPRRFTQGARDAADGAFEEIDEPIRLSALSAQLRSAGDEEAAELLTYFAYGATALDDEVLRSGRTVVAAAPDGELDDELFCGPDLVLGRLRPDVAALGIGS